MAHADGWLQFMRHAPLDANWPEFPGSRPDRLLEWPATGQRIGCSNGRLDAERLDCRDEAQGDDPPQ
jgi:hypothetical protein